MTPLPSCQGLLELLPVHCTHYGTMPAPCRPWLSILWHDLGFSGGQIGILSGLRPFISAVAGGC